MKLSGDWLTRPETQAVLALLSDAGYRALVVGGAVRNAVMGLAASDLDISTDARPERVAELAEAAGLRAIPTGIDHGTVTVVVDGMPFEITTFRRDVETDGRRAVVAFSDRIEEDALRRDFTMNALYCEADGTLVDPLQGLDDALQGRVRFIEDPVRRIREDYLRILRFFRFHAWYGSDEIEPEGLAACADEVDGLEGLSKERIGAETLKLLAAPDPAPAVAAFAATGGLARILPGADPRYLAPLIHVEQLAGLEPSPLRRLAALGGSGEAKALRLSKADARHLDRVRQALGEGEAPAVTAYRHGAAVAVDAALITAATLGLPPNTDLLPEAQRGAALSFPVRAADLPHLKGAELGARLKALEADWIASGFALSREDLLAG